MNTKILLFLFITITLSSCFYDKEKNEETLKIITEKQDKLNSINGNTLSGEVIQIEKTSTVTNSGILEIGDEKEILKEIIEDKKEKLEQIFEDKETEIKDIKTDELLDDISENYDKEIEEEILKLFE